MEREVLFTGIGGQGVQIASKALATAAVAEGRHVMLVPRYGGGMRGGMTNAEVTIGDRPLRALPVASSAWSAYVMDATFWSTIASKLRAGALVVVNSSLVTKDLDLPGATRVDVAASDVASDLGSPMSAGFVLLGAFVALTGLVELDQTLAAMQALIPAYRTQHIEANERALRAGAETVPALGVPAWTTGAVAADAPSEAAV